MAITKEAIEASLGKGISQKAFDYWCRVHVAEVAKLFAATMEGFDSGFDDVTGKPVKSGLRVVTDNG
jgi:hypothetical protein